MTAHPRRAWFPIHGWIGLALMLGFWYVNWTEHIEGPRSHWAFFPMWLGYCLTVDALSVLRQGTSLLRRSVGGYLGMFLISAPVWWLFEVLNWRLGNWEYKQTEAVGPPWEMLLMTVSFSTVIPAVFGTAELVGTFRWVRRLREGPRVDLRRSRLVAYSLAGAAMLALLLAWPRYFYPFAWLSLFFLIDPLNVAMGNRSLLATVGRADWRPVVALAVGVLICGFFWELWNYHSSPKWVYHVPFVGFLRVFEMPLLGYLGYIPFAMELYAMYHLVVGLVAPRAMGRLVRIVPGEPERRTSAAGPQGSETAGA